MSSSPESPAPEDIYVEYRRWKFFWGLLVDSQVEINELLQEHNRRGFRTVVFHHHNGIVPNIGLGMLLLVVIVQTLTLGFISYYVGPSFVFTRAGAGKGRTMDEGAPWPCPKCSALSPNSTTKCVSCGYSLF